MAVPDVPAFRWACAAEWVGEAREVLRGFPALPALPLDPPPAPPHAGAWVGHVLGPTGELALRELAGRFHARYAAVEAFHAGRPDEPGSYARNGVRAASAAALAAEARARFVGGRVTPAVFAEVLGRQDLSVVEGGCGFSLDGRFPRERETFYLLYGSHFLLGMAVQLERATGVDLRARLRGRGVPTLLTCAVPLDRVPGPAVEALCRECLRLALAGWRGDAPPFLRLDFNLTAGLPPAYIRGYDHPELRADPLRRPVPITAPSP